jgi:hypothetical protein
MQRRRRFKQLLSLKERLFSFAKGMRRRPGCATRAGKDDLLKRARGADTACRLDDWVNSPGLQPPK